MAVNLLFKALQDETRRQILQMLKKKDLTAGQIADAFSISKPSISYHLDLLKQAGLISSKKEGQFTRYTLETTVLDEALGWIIDILSSEKKPKRPKSNP